MKNNIFSPTFSPLRPHGSFPPPVPVLTCVSWHDSPVPDVRECVKCVWNADGARTQRVALGLCGLVTLWPCGVAATCPLALPINYRWNQVPGSRYAKHDTLSHTQVWWVTITVQNNMLQ